jgi:hypothetical protein
MALQINSPTTPTSIMEVEATSKAARVLLYDSSGNVIALANRAAVPETEGGLINAGKDYKLARTLRSGSTGALQFAGDETILLADSFEGTTRNLNQWIETLTTMASAQALATGLTLNSASTVTTTTGILESSHRQFPVYGRCGLLFRAHCRVLGATNCVEELGFSDQTSATVALSNNGAFFRRDSAGSLQPVLAFNGTETQGSVMTQPATTDYAWYEIFLEDSRATFQIFSATGTLISAQVMEIGSAGGGGGSTTQARLFAVTHLPCMLRVYNTGAAGTAPQIIVNQVIVQMLDAWAQRSHAVQQSGMGLNSLVNPTTFLQTANYANSAAPASATLSNTAAGYTTLGGQYQFAAQATNETDFALFGWQNPTPFTFYCTGIRIGEMMNLVVVVTTTPSVYMWGAAFNSSAVSLATAAPYTPMRVQLGVQGFPTSAINTTLGAIGAVSPGFMWTPGTPMAVQPARFLHIILKQMLGSATATEIFRGAVTVDGFFE